MNVEKLASREQVGSYEESVMRSRAEIQGDHQDWFDREQGRFPELNMTGEEAERVLSQTDFGSRVLGKVMQSVQRFEK